MKNEGTLVRLIPLDVRSQGRSDEGHATKYRVELGDLGEAGGTVTARQLAEGERDYEAHWLRETVAGYQSELLGHFSTPQAAALRIAAEELVATRDEKRALGASLVQNDAPVPA